MKIIKFLVFLLIFGVFATNSFASISCWKEDTVDTECTSGINVLNLYSNFLQDPVINSHAQLPDETNYTAKICCEGNGFGIGTITCDQGTNEDNIYISIADYTNAHGEFVPDFADNTFSWPSDYSNTLCMETTGPLTYIRCEALPASDPDPSDNGFQPDECIAGLSGPTNAHFYDCESTPSFGLKVYCTDTTTPPNGGGTNRGDVFEVTVQTTGTQGYTTVFSVTDTITAEITVTNKSSINAAQTTLDYFLKGEEGTAIVAGPAAPVSLGPFESTVIYWDIPNPGLGNYSVETSVDKYETSNFTETFLANNSYSHFISVLPENQQVSVPETAPLLAVVIAFFVLAVIGRNSSKRKS